nr:hypothetical protein [Pseudomonas cichorii]
MASPPQHDKLLPGWLPPEPPEGYRNLVAFFAPITLDNGQKSNIWILDYFDTETAFCASEFHEFDVPWPWVSGFQPEAHDWDSIGIPHLI